MTHNPEVIEIKDASRQVTSTQAKITLVEETCMIQSDTQSGNSESKTVSTGLGENEPIENAEKDMDKFAQDLVSSEF